jgi:hypothetical protein
MTRRHFYSLTYRQSKAIRRAFAIVLAALWLASASFADSVTLPDLRDLSLTNWNCLTQREGAPKNPAGAARNRMKNRDWIAVASSNVPAWSYSQFVDHALSLDAEINATHRSNLTAEAQARLATVETQIVSVTGWMVLTYPGPPESCNCNSAEFHDWHIELLPKPLDHAPKIGDTTAMICEVTPRTEAALYRAGIRMQKLAEFMNIGKTPQIVARPTGALPHKVRITGYLMWDDEHNLPDKDIGTKIERGGDGEYHHPWRATAWEIHPILKIEDLGTKE